MDEIDDGMECSIVEWCYVRNQELQDTYEKKCEFVVVVYLNFLGADRKRA